MTSWEEQFGREESRVPNCAPAPHFRPAIGRHVYDLEFGVHAGLWRILPNTVHFFVAVGIPGAWVHAPDRIKMSSGWIRPYDQLSFIATT